MQQTQKVCNATYQAIVKAIDEICKVNRIDDTHGLPHALMIASKTRKALEEEDISPELYEDLIYTALLHDVDDKKYFNTVNYSNASSILRAVNLSQHRVENVLKMISLVSFSANGNHIDKELPISCYIVRYVDRSEAIGIQGLYRTLLYDYAKTVRSPMFLQTTPKPKNEEELMAMSEGRDKEYQARGGKSASVIDHVYDKMVHIKLPQEMKNTYLANMYRIKQQEMIVFLLKHAKNGYVDFESDLIHQYETKVKPMEGLE